jgi:5-methylcytosine-specific restriction endonuclease McrA
MKASKKHKKNEHINDATCADNAPQSASCDTGVLVLNHNFEPLNVCGLKRGLILMLLGKAEVVRFSETIVHSADEEIFAPSVLRLHRMVKRPQPKLKMSRRSILARDDYTCQYCGSRSNLTIDHVFPRHRGGETTW